VSDAPLRVWVDTDIGDTAGDNPDDAIALALAARHPGVELVGVSTVWGDVERRAEVARALLDAFGSTVPVHAGAPPPGASAAAGADALLAIGPLANVAALVARGEPLPPRAAAMGGVLGEVVHRGRRADDEHNFACDRAAAEAVVTALGDLLLVPLDVTARVVLDETGTRALQRAVPPLAQLIDDWRAATGQPLCLHDPLALLALVRDGTVGLRVARRPVFGVERDVVVDVGPTAAIARVLRVTEGD
jgi:inosine-uridine nucleoside N-ribohydrolase